MFYHLQCQASDSKKKEAEKKLKKKGRQAERATESGATKLGALFGFGFWMSECALESVCLHKQAVEQTIDRATHHKEAARKITLRAKKLREILGKVN